MIIHKKLSARIFQMHTNHYTYNTNRIIFQLITNADKITHIEFTDHEANELITAMTQFLHYANTKGTNSAKTSLPGPGPDA